MHFALKHSEIVLVHVSGMCKAIYVALKVIYRGFLNSFLVLYAS